MKRLVNPMTKRLALLITGALLPCVAAQAVAGYDQAQVVRTTPLYETVRYAVPRRVCHDERVERSTGGYSVTGPVLGALIGAGIGSAVGHHKDHKHVGTAVGAVLGAAIGHDVSRRNSERGTRYDDELTQVCREEQDYRQEQRITGYNVTYRYAGETYTTQMSRDPGRTLRVRVDVAPVDDDNYRDEPRYRDE